MNKLICSRCQSTFYTAAPTSEIPCPFCGFVSRKSFEPERRLEKRMLVERGCELVLAENKKIHGRIVDISLHGVGVETPSPLTTFQRDEMLEIVAEDLDIKSRAQVRWTNRINGVVKAGLLMV
ncbi:MAG TPA: hypothetical protein ENJ37_00010 [Deltaproteobacteria bacterium]|nr:hypothetical protein [Deltaproteobacteria bacterium]